MMADDSGGTVESLTLDQVRSICRCRIYVSIFMAALVAATWIIIWLAFP